ncbi:hypothetical protein [Photobacterium angustum]|uniref:hypothetical protein n=1 Tax=Photobacterium angustum TaxID=661 RepID=UPI0011D109EB|nr:hypothetical protein [Photobacterium angustum]
MKIQCKACGSYDLSRIRRSFIERIFLVKKYSCYDCGSRISIYKNRNVLKYSRNGVAIKALKNGEILRVTEHGKK